MVDMWQGVSEAVGDVLEELAALRGHAQWRKAAPEAILTEIDLLGDTVFGRLHSLTKAIDRDAPGADVERALAAVQVAQMPASKRMAAFLLLAIELAAEVPASPVEAVEP
jgi:predicted nucleic acid-binding Zn ribbon protein